MAKFLDFHEKLPPMPPEAMQQMTAAMKAGQADPFGIKHLNLFVGTAGQGWCLSEGPNTDAVVKSHGAMGITISAKDVIEVSSLV